jgi:hypothetical protein
MQQRWIPLLPLLCLILFNPHNVKESPGLKREDKEEEVKRSENPSREVPNHRSTII